MKKNREIKMTFENAKKYQLEDKKHIAIECDNGYTYYNDEVR